METSWSWESDLIVPHVALPVIGPGDELGLSLGTTYSGTSVIRLILRGIRGGGCSPKPNWNPAARLPLQDLAQFSRLRSAQIYLCACGQLELVAALEPGDHLGHAV